MWEVGVAAEPDAMLYSAMLLDGMAGMVVAVGRGNKSTCIQGKVLLPP